MTKVLGYFPYNLGERAEGEKEIRRDIAVGVVSSSSEFLIWGRVAFVFLLFLFIHFLFLFFLEGGGDVYPCVDGSTCVCGEILFEVFFCISIYACVCVFTCEYMCMYFGVHTLSSSPTYIVFFNILWPLPRLRAAHTRLLPKEASDACRLGSAQARPSFTNESADAAEAPAISEKERAETER